MKTSERARTRREKWSAVRKVLLEGDPLRLWWIAVGWPDLYEALYACFSAQERTLLDQRVAEGARLYEERKRE